ncbi:MAG: acetyl-CoA acetyltransferase [Dehalococcoidia bacterium]|nr:acetyl-CoA acetyltransferase [Dehalococcoidia bacterium]
MGALTGKAAIVGVGQTEFYRDAKRTTLSLGLEAIKKAVADAGLRLSDIDGMTSYQTGDSHSSNDMAQSLGMRLNYAVDIMGGGSSSEALVAHAAGLLAGGYCRAIVIFRSMRGRTGRRMGGQALSGPQPNTVVTSDGQGPMVGVTTPAQNFGMAAMRYMHDYGVSTRQLAAVALTHRYHANLNPKAVFYKQPLTLEDYYNARWVSKPFRLYDCCLERDVSCAMVLMRREDSYDLRHPPVFVLGGTARTMSESPSYNAGRLHTPIYWHGSNWGRNRAFGMSGVTRSDINVASFYDAFTITPLLQMEGYGFVKPGEAGFWYQEGRGLIDGDLPVNTSGSHLSEGYSHGIQMVIEMTRQLRGRADDACPNWEEGIHTYDRKAGCRQVKKHDVGFCSAWGSPTQSSSLVLSQFATAN